jgi:hypothetical protein
MPAGARESGATVTSRHHRTHLRKPLDFSSYSWLLRECYS